MKSKQRSLRSRVSYFSRALFREALPNSVHRARTRRLIKAYELHGIPGDILDRVSYCNKLAGQTRPSPDAVPIGKNSHRNSPFYMIDFLEYARGFGPNLPVTALFGDITHIPEYPTIVKSRPIRGDNANSIIFPLDKFRHLNFFPDPVDFAAKRPFAVWRGRPNNSQRTRLVNRFKTHPDHDIGMVHDHASPQNNKDWLSFRQEFAFRYILSIEGNDVATNLKRIMASNSAAISPPLTYETWFMEGKLIPDTHFIGIRPDFSDLQEKIDFYEAHPEKLKSIIKNANDWTLAFRNKSVERLISTFVLQKYFEMTGALPTSAQPAHFFAPKRPS